MNSIQQENLIKKMENNRLRGSDPAVDPATGSIFFCVFLYSMD